MIYITGATGKLGKYVYNLLSEKTEVVPLVRKPSGLKNEVVTDFSEESLKGILEDASTIIHLAGAVSYDKKILKESNVDLTRALVNAAPEKARIVFSGSISVYGKRLLKKPADERTPINPDSWYSRSKYEAERMVSARPNSLILRIGIIYGPFEDYRVILSKIKRGKMPIIGNGNNYIPFVYVEDVAKIIVDSLNKRGVYNIVADELMQKEIYGIAAEELGVKTPSGHMAFSFAYFSALIAEKVALLTGGRCKLTTEHISILHSDRAFDCSKAKKELGFSPIRTAEGIRKVTRELQKSL